MKITKRQLRRIIKEERRRLQEYGMEGALDLSGLEGEIYSGLEDVIMANLPPDVDMLTAEEFGGFEKSVLDALEQMRDRVVEHRGLGPPVTIGPPV